MSTTDVADGGYICYRFQVCGTRRRFFAHALVLTAFRGPCPPGQLARHLNGDSKNNALTNLTWGTPSENMHDAVRHGTHFEARQTHCKWKHPLLDFNLVRWWLPHRKCLACARARAYIFRCGGDMQTVSDHYFSQLVPTVTARTA